MKVINPATAQGIATLVADAEKTVNIKIARLKEGQKEWKKVPVAERLACIVRFGELIQANLETLAATLTAETGKPIQQSLNEIRGAHTGSVICRKMPKTGCRRNILSRKGLQESLLYMNH